MSYVTKKILLTVISVFSICVTFLATGWMTVFFFWLFGLCFIFQLRLIWQPEKHFNNWMIPIFITTLLFLIFCLFREDFSDSHISTLTPFHALKYHLGFEENHAYQTSKNDLYGVINFLFTPLLALQIFILVKIRKEKNNLDSLSWTIH